MHPKDTAEYGLAYWHRSHQLPGTLDCVGHGEPLLSVPMQLTPSCAIAPTLSCVFGFETQPTRLQLAVGHPAHTVISEAT